MIVLARVNGYYSPHFPMSVMEEEDKAFHNINFTYAETDFFTNKLKQAFPKMDRESLTNAINFSGETERGQLSLFNPYSEEGL